MASSKKSNKSKTFSSDNAGLTNNPFASLQGATVPDGPAPTAQSSAPAPSADSKKKPKGLAAVGRVIVRRQKKGQGGKTVSCVEGVPASIAGELVPRLKRALGCSGRVQDDVMILGTSDQQGVARWLESQGATNVRLGN